MKSLARLLSKLLGKVREEAADAYGHAGSFMSTPVNVRTTYRRIVWSHAIACAIGAGLVGALWLAVALR